VKKALRFLRYVVRPASAARQGHAAHDPERGPSYILQLECRRKKKSVQWTVFPPNKYSGMLPTDMKRLRELEDENSRLKKIVADLALDKEMLQDVLKRKL
jgi:putative transposase